MYPFTRKTYFICLAFLFGIAGALYAEKGGGISAIPPASGFVRSTGEDSLSAARDEHGNTWIEGHIPASLLNVSVVLYIPNVYVRDYDLYVRQGGKLVQVPANINFNKKEVRTRFPLYYFKPDATGYYLNIGKQPLESAQVVVAEMGQIMQHEAKSLIQNSLYYGLAFMAVIFNFILYLIFRDRRFAIYSLLQLSLFSIFLYQDGLLYYISRGRWDIPHFLLWNIAFCAVLSGIFAYYFLNLGDRAPYFKKISIWLTGAIFGSVLLYIGTGMPFFRVLSSVFFYLFPGIYLYRAVRTFREDVYARFLVLFFGLVFLAGAVFTLRRYFDLPFLSFFDIGALRLTSVVEIIGISFALIFKVRTLQEENERYRTELRHYLEHRKQSEASLKEKPSAVHPLPEAAPAYAVNQPMADLIGEIAAQHDLTEREKEVLHGIWNGCSNQEMADMFYISVNTVKFHVSRLYMKLDVKNRSELRSMKASPAGLRRDKAPADR